MLSSVASSNNSLSVSSMYSSLPSAFNCACAPSPGAVNAPHFSFNKLTKYSPDNFPNVAVAEPVYPSRDTWRAPKWPAIINAVPSVSVSPMVSIWRLRSAPVFGAAGFNSADALPSEASVRPPDTLIPDTPNSDTAVDPAMTIRSDHDRAAPK